MKFELLTRKRALGTANLRDYTNWAESMLYENVGSENLAILASMGYERDPDSEEIEMYFLKSIKDLNLSLPEDQTELRNYAEDLCKLILSDELEPEEGVSILERLYSKSDYEPLYSIWDNLGEDLWVLDDCGSCIFNSGLNTENKKEFIKNVAAQFITLLSTNLPDQFFTLCACPACGYIGKNKLEVIEKPWLPKKLFRFLYQRGPTHQTVCASCKRPSPISMSDYEGRKQYLDCVGGLKG